MCLIIEYVNPKDILHQNNWLNIFNYCKINYYFNSTRLTVLHELFYMLTDLTSVCYIELARLYY